MSALNPSTIDFAAAIASAIKESIEGKKIEVQPVTLPVADWTETHSVRHNVGVLAGTQADGSERLTIWQNNRKRDVILTAVIFTQDLQGNRGDLSKIGRLWHTVQAGDRYPVRHFEFAGPDAGEGAADFSPDAASTILIPMRLRVKTDAKVDSVFSFKTGLVNNRTNLLSTTSIVVSDA